MLCAMLPTPLLQRFVGQIGCCKSSALWDGGLALSSAGPPYRERWSALSRALGSHIELGWSAQRAAGFAAAKL